MAARSPNTECPAGPTPRGPNEWGNNWLATHPSTTPQDLEGALLLAVDMVHYDESAEMDPVPMDPEQVGRWFSRWVDGMRASCGVNAVEISVEAEIDVRRIGPADDYAPWVRVKLTCPTCGKSIAGSMAARLVPALALLVCYTVIEIALTPGWP